MVAIVDYGVGNLFSLSSSLAAIGQEAVVSGDPKLIASADRVILPGVGAFRDAAAKLRLYGLDEAVKKAAGSGRPLLGICLGMQLLFDESFEYGRWDGLGLLKGSVKPIKDFIPAGLKIPHMGWNGLDIVKDSPLLGRIKSGDQVYFVHSYAVTGCEDSLLATAEYGAKLTAAVGRDNVFGCQFHPEKSGDVGLDILRAFCEDI
jgi:glutamine amidotransferase